MAPGRAPVREDGRSSTGASSWASSSECLLPRFGNGVQPHGLTVHGLGEDANGELYAMVTNTPSNGTGGIIYRIESIPAPGAMGLLGLGGVVAARRRRN